MMTRAELETAVRSGAYLSGANLSGANLGTQWIIQGSTRSDGYAFFLQMLTGDLEPLVKAGCRYLTLTAAQVHWETTRGGTALGRETEVIVSGLVDLAHIRGKL